MQHSSICLKNEAFDNNQSICFKKMFHYSDWFSTNDRKLDLIDDRKSDFGVGKRLVVCGL